MNRIAAPTLQPCLLYLLMLSRINFTSWIVIVSNGFMYRILFEFLVDLLLSVEEPYFRHSEPTCTSGSFSNQMVTIRMYSIRYIVKNTLPLEGSSSDAEQSSPSS